MLDGALRARGVTTLVVTGTMTDICVLATVVGGFNREYRMIVVEDGVATLWPEIQRATLDIIGRAYARVHVRQGRRRRAGARLAAARDVLASEPWPTAPLPRAACPANLLPFTADLDDRRARLPQAPALARRHARRHRASWPTATRPRSSSLTREERKRALAIALDEVAGKVPGRSPASTRDGTLEAVELARDARAAGAAGLLVFPPTLFMWGAQVKPDMVLRHFQTIADARGPAARRLRVPARLRHRLQPGDARRALQDPHGGRR